MSYKCRTSKLILLLLIGISVMNIVSYLVIQKYDKEEDDDDY